MKSSTEHRARLRELAEDRKSMIAIRDKLCIGISRIDNNLIGNKDEMKAVAELLIKAIAREKPPENEAAA